jgi:tetratricopeptide (TPR) repeat protein
MVKLGKYDDALELYDKVLGIEPKHVSALYNKANLLVKIEKYLEAISCYEKVVQIDPTNIPALYNKRIALEKVGKHYGIGLTTVKQLL